MARLAGGEEGDEVGKLGRLGPFAHGEAGEDLLLPALAFHEGLRPLSADEARRDDIGKDLLPRIGPGDALGEILDRRLRGAVREGAGIAGAALRRPARHRNDDAAAVLAEMPDGVAQKPGGGEQVYLERLVPDGIPHLVGGV